MFTVPGVPLPVGLPTPSYSLSAGFPGFPFWTLGVGALAVLPVHWWGADWLCSLCVTGRGKATAFLHNRVTGERQLRFVGRKKCSFLSYPPSDPRVLLCGRGQAAYRFWAQLRVCRQRCPPCRVVCGSAVALGSAEGL